MQGSTTDRTTGTKATARFGWIDVGRIDDRDLGHRVGSAHGTCSSSGSKKKTDVVPVAKRVSSFIQGGRESETGVFIGCLQWECVK